MPLRTLGIAHTHIHSHTRAHTLICAHIFGYSAVTQVSDDLFLAAFDFLPHTQGLTLQLQCLVFWFLARRGGVELLAEHECNTFSVW